MDLSIDLHYELLDNRHKTLITNFKCYESELEYFLKEDALNNQKIGISKTYLWINKDNNLVAYVTILMDSLRLEGKMRDFFKEKEIYYKTLPALKIGRLAVHDSYQKQGIGTHILQFLVYLGKKLSNNVIGCRYLILDAKQTQESKHTIHFYKKSGFEVLKQREKGTIPMYLDLFS